MKILITSWHLDHISGVETYVNELINNLKDENEIKHFVQGLKPKYHKKSVLTLVYPYQSIKFAFKLNSIRPDVVHLNPSLLWASIVRDIVFLNIAKLQGYPVLFFIRGWDWSIYEKIKTNNTLNRSFTDNLEKADKILVLSRDFQKALIKLGIDEEKIGLTSTMVESEKYRPDNKDFSNPYKVLLCSRMAKDKGPFELLDAIPEVIKVHPETRFIYMGDGPCLDDLKKKARDMGIDDNVVFTGYKTGEDKIEWYKRSHIFTFPTYHGEGFPNVALEAMAAGLPVITTKNAGLKRAIKEGENGYFLSSMPSDPDEIAENIIQLLNNPEKMEEISEKNLKKAKEKYDVAAVSQEITEIYNELSK